MEQLGRAELDELVPEAIVATCQRGRDRQAVGILDLPHPHLRPEDAQWIAAYRQWNVR
jgi:hypothetical protein